MRRNMKAERARLGMTAKEVANKIGAHENAVLRWEQGTSEPLGTNLIRLSELYGCTPEYLLGVVDGRTDTKSDFGKPKVALNEEGGRQ